MKVKKGDRVVVIAGKDRGKLGEVMRIFTTEDRVVVAGVNMQKKHTKARGKAPGGIIVREGSIHVSNVMLIDPQNGKRTRVGYRFTASGKKERFAKLSGEGFDTTGHETAVQTKTKKKAATI